MEICYQLNFYLNGEHYINHSDKRGEVHPHSWEAVIKIIYQNEQDGFRYFSEMEQMIENYLSIYEGQLINTIAPFDMIEATLENMAKVFYQHMTNILDKRGFKLVELVVKESPKRSVMISSANSYQKPQNPTHESIKNEIVSLSLLKKKA